MAEALIDGIGSGYFAKVNSLNRLAVESDEATYKQVMAYNANGMVEYIGKAEPNSGIAGSIWQIQKLTYNSNMGVTNIDFASGTNNFMNIWSGATINYTTYPYN